MRTSQSAIATVTIAVLVATCGDSREQQSAAVAEALEPALEQYSLNELREALPLFRAVVADHPGSAEAQAWVAETAR